MPKKKLTSEEKATLLAIVDSTCRDDYDEEFYELLLKPDVPKIEDLDDRIRRAITKFVSGYYENVMMYLLEDTSPDEAAIKAGLATCLLRGYKLGKELRRPLTTKREGR